VKLGLVQPGSCFVDVGCNHPCTHSNTHYFEKNLGCSGLAFDGQDFSQQYLSIRPKTRFRRCLIDQQAASLDLNIVCDVEGLENQISSTSDCVIKHRGLNYVVESIPCYPLSFLCSSLSRIDLLCIDVEGHEISVLRSIDYSLLRPRVILVENNGVHHPRCVIYNLMLANGYRQVARISDSDDVYVDQR